VLIATLVAVLSALAIAVPVASGAVGHGFVSRVGEAPSGSKLVEPGAVAVERSSGRVFLGDAGRGVVDVFSASGGFVTVFGEGLEPSGVAVDQGSGDVFVASGSAVDVFRPDGSGGYVLLSEWSGAGTSAGQFGEVRGVAVDNSKGVSAGDVYVVDASNGVVDVFKPKPVGSEEAKEGEFVRKLGGPRLEEPNGVAVDAGTGKVYVADSVKGVVDIYSPSGTVEGKLTGAGSPEGSFRGPEGEEGNVRAVAAEEGSVYVAEGERHVVSQFNATGEWVGWITTAGSGGLVEPGGVAVAPTGGVYVADAGAGLLDVFGEGVAVPDAKTTAATKIAKTSVLLHAVVNGDGKPAKYHFEWGTTEAYGSNTPSTTSGGGEEKIKAELTGLTAGVSYHFRLVVENENGQNVGVDKELETLPAVEGLSTGPVQNIKPTEATLEGSLTPHGTDAHYLFEWGLSTSYGTSTSSVDAGSGKEPVAAKTELAGLAPNTTYHYRLVGTDVFGTTVGADVKFTTSGPPRITNVSPSGITHETATINAKVNPDELETKYAFEYGETTGYGTETPAGGAKLPAGETPLPISAALTGLKIGVTYHYRVVASNGAGSTLGHDEIFTTIPPALIEGTSATEVSSTTAVLRARINPLGHDTTYYFQYGTESCVEHSGACTDLPAPPGEDIGAGEEDIAKGVHLSGLKPMTTYHYRVLAANSLGAAEGVERTFTTQQPTTAFALLDGRAWEMVSPPNKAGAPVEALTREGGLILASEDGNALTYVVDGALGEEVQGNRSPEWQQVLARRGTGGWSSQDIATPSTKAEGARPGQTPEYQFFTPDLSVALVQPAGQGAEPPLAPGVTQATMYLRDDATGTYLPLVTEANVAPGTMFGTQLQFVSATPDLSHVVIASNVALTGPSSEPGLYEWAAGALELVSVLPAGTPAKGSVELGYSHDAANAISSDGSRIIWTTAEEEPKLGHLYMRDTATGKTVQLDAAQGIAEPSGRGTARFQTASSDGSRVFFTDKQQLTADSTAEPVSNRPDLYECEMVAQAGKLACKLTDLTVDHNVGENANVPGVLLGASEHGASVYFVAEGVLSENQNGNGETAAAGKDNLYEAHYDGTRWTTTFIAILASADNPEWEANRVADTAFLTARVSPNGQYLAFMSAASPTGYDNVDANPEAKGARDEEVYLYDASNASLRCVSCNPSGARPTGVFDTEGIGEGLGLLADRRKVWFGHWLAGNIPGWTAENLVSALVQSRYLSNNGRLFFNSPDSLVAQAANHKENVYEYEPAGLGSCVSPTGGCVSLLSSGSSSKESAFIEATPDGSNVFFATVSQLLPQDTDTAYDIYDARECTQASPCLTPSSPAQPGCSNADACRPASPSQQAPVEPSGTATLSGSGDMVQSPHAKQETKGVKTKSKPLNRAQKLSKALKSCKKRHSKKKRKACEKHARKLYGVKTTTAKGSAKQSSGGRSSGRGRR
jgi:hypothetical protein